MILMVGARRTSTPLLRTSRPSARVSSSTRSSLQVAASATGQGNEVDGLAGAKRDPTTPARPSAPLLRAKPEVLCPLRTHSARTLHIPAARSRDNPAFEPASTG